MSESTEIALAAPAAAAPGESIWGAVREALRGSRRNYTEGPIGRAILILAIPMVLEMVMESVFVVCDVFFVSKLGAGCRRDRGADRVAARDRLHDRDGTLDRRDRDRRAPHRRARRARARRARPCRAIALGLSSSLVLGVLGAIFAPPLLRAHGRVPDVLAIGSRFTRVMLGGNASILLLFLINGIFRGAGDAQLSHAHALARERDQHLLGPCLIFGLGPFPRLGVDGRRDRDDHRAQHRACCSAWRSSSGGAAGCTSIAGISTLDPALMLKLLRLSGSGMFQVLIGTASWIGLVRILAGVRQHGARGVHDRHSDRPVRAAAVVGNGERGGDDGRPGVRRGQA